MLEIRGHVVMGFREGEEEQHLTIPEGIEAIAPKAFQNCRMLESVHFPKSLRTIGEKAFYGCDCLEEVHVPEGLTEIGKEAFSGTALQSVELPGTLRVVPHFCFANCETITKVILHEGIESVEGWAFGDAPINELTLPDTLTSIGICAFANVRDEVVLPPHLTHVEPDAFSGRLVISPESTVYRTIDGVLYDKNLTTLIYMPEACCQQPLPESVHILGDYFLGNAHLPSFTLPDRFDRIMEHAFCGPWTDSTIRTLYLQHPLCTVPLSMGGSVEQEMPKLLRFLECHDLPERERLLTQALQETPWQFPLAIYLMVTQDSKVGRRLFQKAKHHRWLFLLTQPPAYMLAPVLERRLLPKSGIEPLLEDAIAQNLTQAQMLLTRYKQEMTGYSDPTKHLKL